MSRFLATLALLFGLLSPPLQAQPTGLDPSFDGDGELLIPFPGLTPGSNDVYLDRLGLDHDERILLAGVEGTFGSYRGIVGRLLANGSADPAWAGSGFSVLDQRTDMGVADLVALPDGATLVCGNYRGTTVDRRWVFVARFLANGQLDPSFATASATPGIFSPSRPVGTISAAARWNCWPTAA